MLCIVDTFVIHAHVPGGEMGPTLKVKRHLVMQKYKENVDKLYAA